MWTICVIHPDITPARIGFPYKLSTSFRVKFITLWMLSVSLLAAIVPPGVTKGHHRVYPLRQTERWLLNPTVSGRFDASALLRLTNGILLTVNDKSLPLCKIDLKTNGVAAVVPISELFSLEAVRKAAGNPRYAPDTEGIAVDEAGRIYICTEGQRWIFRSEADGSGVTRLDIDWTPVKRWFHPSDGNAAWEGIAVGDGKLYLANERSVGRIVVVDLMTLKVIDDFQVAPAGKAARDIHYSDLCWWKGDLWVLCRESRCVLRVNPTTHSVISEFDFAAIELDRNNIYLSALPFGFMEGLLVDDRSIWLAVDNNGLPRRSAPTDFRGLLLRCPRPDLQPENGN